MVGYGHRGRMLSMKEILVTDKLCKTFSNGGQQQHILKNLDLTIYDGDFTVIMGPSGAGKSTLLYALSGMDTPSLGHIYFQGEDISTYNNDQLAVFRRTHCGFVFQQVYLLDSMSVMDNVLAAGLLASKNKTQVIKDAKELFEKVDLDVSTQRKFSTQISGGEAQRAGIVRALINHPDIIFADEPTGQLNSSSSKAVLDVFSTLHQQQQSIVMVTHDMTSAIRGNRILYLRDGHIQGECQLGEYQNDDEQRHEKLTSFLMKMGW